MNYYQPMSMPDVLQALALRYTMAMDKAALLDAAKAVLETNNQGSYTKPAEGLYPHQWLWDSCFIAIGLRHYDVDRAKQEVLSLLRGQWSNGMLPNMIFAPGAAYNRDRKLWRSEVSPYAPDDVATSGVTQPPLLAEAVVRIGKKLPLPERRTWYKTIFPALLKYHQWLYTERDPHAEGLVLLVHPWECGLDNTPPWMNELHQHLLPWWIRLAEMLRLHWLIDLFRRDIKYAPPEQRLSSIEALAFFDIQQRLKRKGYNIDQVLPHSLLSVEDVIFNSILIRANHHLKTIARAAGHSIPTELTERMDKTEKALEGLWDPYSSQYYSRNFVTHKLLKIPSIATFLPLYAGTISQERADQLVQLLHNKQQFGPLYPVPSMPVSSPWFHPTGYWQGPTWINTNWLIIDGLKRYGYTELAEEITQKSLELVAGSGNYEYFSPLDGQPAGSNNFSWTAALTIDFLQAK